MLHEFWDISFAMRIDKLILKLFLMINYQWILAVIVLVLLICLMPEKSVKRIERLIHAIRGTKNSK
jgi:hypothetical protein